MSVPLRVLILEDQPADADLMVRELRRAGFDPDWCRVEVEEDYLIHLDPALDVILADYRLPRFDALTALHRLQERGLDIPFIVVTGALGDEAAAECVKKGATDFLLKDRLARLGPAVVNALEQRRLRREQREAEMALRESEARYRAICELTSDYSYSLRVGPEGNLACEWVAGPFTHVTGFSPEEVDARSVWASLAHPNDMAIALRHAQAVFSGVPDVSEFRIVTKRGETRWVRDHGRPVWDGGQGRVVRIYGAVQDISERKRAEEIRQALYQASLEIQTPRQMERRLQGLLQGAGELLELDRSAILLPDREGRWLQVVARLGIEDPVGPVRIPIGAEGGALARAFQTRQPILWDGQAPVPEEFWPQAPYDRFTVLRAEVFASVPLLIQGGAIGVLWADRSVSRQRFDPSTLEFLQLFASHAAPAIEQARLYEELRQSAIHLEAMVEDRTRELQAANAQLQEPLRQAQSEFPADMIHELRTPLNCILAFSDLLLGEGVGPLSEKQARYLGHIHQGGKHLLRLINDLLDLSKMEAGRLEVRPEPLLLREALGQAVNSIQPQAEEKRIALRVEVGEAVLRVAADPVRFTQIIYNLLSNALKFTPEGGRVTVAARRTEDDLAEIRVTDTGIGIRAEDLGRLFQPFTQLEAPHGKHHHGTGLGLALTRRLVELQGGRIGADSEGEGRGSTFTVILPVAGSKSRPAQSVVARGSSRRGSAPSRVA
jgi:PAS domain S-box-containing protein